MTENQKLREAFETYITDDGKWPNAILKAPGGQYLLLRTSVAWQDWKACAEALAMPTADHIPDAGEKVADHLPDAGKMIETAAPVGERERFEKWASREGYLTTFEPNAMCSKGLPVYKDPRTHAAWWAWQARSALSAGDAVDGPLIDEGSTTEPSLHPVAHIELGDDFEDVVTVEQAQAYATAAVQQYKVDAQRYRWLREQSDDDFAFAVVKNPHFDVYESPEELDFAIDAAMRKGQL